MESFVLHDTCSSWHLVHEMNGPSAKSREQDLRNSGRGTVVETGDFWPRVHED